MIESVELFLRCNFVTILFRWYLTPKTLRSCGRLDKNNGTHLWVTDCHSFSTGAGPLL